MPITKRTHISKAMILAAGLGTRLRPLTNTTPKPLIEIHGKPLIAHALERVAAAGITDVMINLHWLPDQIRNYVGNGSQWGINTYFSHEPELLGTGGGIKNVEDWFKGEPFILYNADILCDFDVAQLTTGATTHPCLVARPVAPGETYTPIDITPDGCLRGFGSGEHHYCGIMRCNSRVVAQLPRNQPSCLITEGFQPLLDESSSIHTVLHHGLWDDIGTVERLEHAHQLFS